MMVAVGGLLIAPIALSNVYAQSAPPSPDLPSISQLERSFPSAVPLLHPNGTLLPATRTALYGDLSMVELVSRAITLSISSHVWSISSLSFMVDSWVRWNMGAPVIWLLKRTLLKQSCGPDCFEDVLSRVQEHHHRFGTPAMLMPMVGGTAHPGGRIERDPEEQASVLLNALKEACDGDAGGSAVEAVMIRLSCLADPAVLMHMNLLLEYRNEVNPNYQLPWAVTLDEYTDEQGVSADEAEDSVEHIGEGMDKEFDEYWREHKEELLATANAELEALKTSGGLGHGPSPSSSSIPVAQEVNDEDMDNIGPTLFVRITADDENGRKPSDDASDGAQGDNQEEQSDEESQAKNLALVEFAAAQKMSHEAPGVLEGKVSAPPCARLTFEEAGEVMDLYKRLQAIGEAAEACGVRLVVAEEPSYLHHVVDFLTQRMANVFNEHEPMVVQSFQLYARNVSSRIEKAMDHARSHHYHPGVRLVVGQFHKEEQVYAEHQKIDLEIYQSPMEICDAFDNGVANVCKAFSRTSSNGDSALDGLLMVQPHSTLSLLRALYQVENHNDSVRSALLEVPLGVGDALLRSLAASHDQHNVRVCRTLPCGDPSMASAQALRHMVNSEDFGSKHELRAVMAEIKHRLGMRSATNGNEG